MNRKGGRDSAGARPRFGTLPSAIAMALAGVSSAGYVQAQQQQPQANPPPLEEITVTGSRILRKDFTANSPIQTVDQQMFEQTSAVGVETILNQLPQFVPAVTQFTTGDVQQTATNTVGASTVSLRGLGPNRNLVLINGHRGMPIDPRMVVDTNSIPAAAIQRVEVISGGASAVYGADAVGGVVNFILKDNFEGASIDVRLGDTQHGGDQNVTLSALMGINAPNNRGNIMFGVERDSRTKEYQWQRDWRIADYANPNTAGGFFAFGSATWWHNEPAANAANPAANDPTQAAVDAIFNQLPAGTISHNLGFPGFSRFRTNRDGTIFSGLNDAAGLAPGSYLFNGPVYNGQDNCQVATCLSQTSGGDLDGSLAGLPVFVRQPNGAIKENSLYSWASIPLERLSSFANGHYALTDRIRVTGQAMLTRTKTETSLGLTAANINQWGAGIPFGNELYRGNSNTYLDIPDSLIDVNGNGIADAGDRTNPAYTLTGRYGVNCDAPVGTPGMPWADGLPGCTKSEAWPTSPDVYNLMITRPRPEETLWASREPDWLRNALGAGRSTTNTTTTASFVVGLEGDFPSDKQHWDMSLYTGRSDNVVDQLGSMRLFSYRQVLASPNYGKGSTFDPNPWESGGFAEGIPTCTSGLPIADNRAVSQDCLQIVSPNLKNVREMTQSIFEFNLVGDLAQMKAGPLSYALGYTYRENSYNYVPDNLSDIQNVIDPIAGLFPTEASSGKFDVGEIYGELLVPIISNGHKGVEHFNLELGGRISDWSMPQMPNLGTYKALIDWGITQRYRVRGGFNRAFRAPNLGELYTKRTELFGGGGATRDWCSTGLSDPGTFSATPGPNVSAAQNAQTLAICQALMGPSGAALYYDPATTQLTAGGLGIPNSFGNPNLREEQADTWTMGVTMEIADDWRLAVDWWKIQIDQMIALESSDTTYQHCLDMAFNPSGSLSAPACQNILRNPTTGGAALVYRSFTNAGATDFEGVDVQLNWQHQLGKGGRINLQSAMTFNLHEITQDTPDVAPVDQTGYNNCSLQLQCLNYDYRIFSTVGYNKGRWGLSVTHQYWPYLANNACRNAPTSQQCVYNSLPGYGLINTSGNIRFDKYTLSVGVQNLLDTDPPCIGANPFATPFPTDCTHTGDGSTYDPLGRRYFVSMTMDF
jgi:iron complex outermembrane recepter protein